jgi:hypothetical protein
MGFYTALPAAVVEKAWRRSTFRKFFVTPFLLAIPADRRWKGRAVPYRRSSLRWLELLHYALHASGMDIYLRSGV